MATALAVELRHRRGSDRDEDPDERSFRRTVQIATVGEDAEGVLAGLRNCPTNKLVLICYQHEKETAERLSTKVAETLKIDVEIYDNIMVEHSYKDMMQVFSQIVEKDRGQYDDYLLNISSGDKMICIAAAVTSFILGVKAFFCKDDQCIMLPPIKLDYTELVSNVKLSILKAVDDNGGEVASLDKLSQVTKYEKPLLSYHIHGSSDARGLIDLGLVDVVRDLRGKTKVRLTTLGKMLLVEKIEART